jgi:hypothetical protein
MPKKIEMNPDNFEMYPMTELNNFINAIIDEKKPYLISATFIKLECQTVSFNVNGEIKKCNINRCLFVKNQVNPGDIVNVDSRNLY